MADRRILGRLFDAITGRGEIGSLQRGTMSDTLSAILNKKGGGSVRHVTVSDPYKEIPAVYRAGNVIKGAFAEGVQELRIRSGKAQSKQDDEVLTYENAKTRPLIDALELFEKPIEMIPEQGIARTMLSARRFKQTVAIQAMIHDAAYVLAVPGRISGMPVRLVPTIPGTIAPKVAESDPFELVCWEFRQRGRAPIPLAPQDVVAIPFAPDPSNIFSGVAPVTPAYDAINAAKAYTTYRRHAMANSGMQGVISLDSDRPLTDPEAKEVKRRFYEENMGPENAEKVMLVTAKAAFTQVSPSTAREMQIQAGEKQALEEILRTTGVTPALAGIFDHSALSRATVMVERAMTYHNSVFDFAGSYDEQMTVFAQRFDERLYVYTNFSNVDALKEDEDSRWARSNVALTQGVSLWEANRLFDLGREDLADESGKPLPHALQSFLPAGLMPAEMVMAGAGAIIAPSLAGGLSSEDLDDAEAAVEAAGSKQELETTQATVLNGAQVTAATDIVQKVATGELPRDSAQGLLETLFNLTTEQAEKMLGSAGTGSPTTPNLNPADDDAGSTSPARGVLSRSRAVDATPQPVSNATRDQIRDAQWRSYNAKLRPFEDKAEAKLRKFILKTKRQILKSLTPTDPDVPAEAQVERATSSLFVSEHAAGIARQVEDFYGFDHELKFRILNRQTAVSRGLERHIARGADDSAGFFDPQAFAELIRSIIQVAFTAGGFGVDRELIDLGIVDNGVLDADRDRLPRIATNYFDSRLGMLTHIGDSMKAEIHSSLLEGYKQGESLSKLSDRVRDISKVSMKRARTIARTEVGTSISVARFENMKKHNRDGEKEWFAGHRPEIRRATHDELDGKRLPMFDKDGKDTWFKNGLTHPKMPGGAAKEVVNCGCELLAVSSAFEAFEAQTAVAASVDVTNDYVMLRASADNLARRAVHLGIECPIASITRHIPAALAEKLKAEHGTIDEPAAFLSEYLGSEGVRNPAVSGAVRSLGGTLFVTQWARAFGQDIGQQIAA